VRQNRRPTHRQRRTLQTCRGSRDPLLLICHHHAPWRRDTQPRPRPDGGAAHALPRAVSRWRNRR
jgi:hypothetical protein